MKRLLTILLFLALTACNFPTPPPIISPTVTTIVTPTNIVTQCAYVEGRKDSTKLSAAFIEKLKAAALPIETARAEAYGENCVAADNTIVRFAQKEIDFYITLNVTDLKDESSLGHQLEEILMVIDQLPPGEIGPNPGYVGVAFQLGPQVQNLWFTLADATALRKQGIKGADLYKALVKKP